MKWLFCRATVVGTPSPGTIDGMPSPEQALRHPDWGAHVLVRPGRSNSLRGPRK